MKEYLTVLSEEATSRIDVFFNKTDHKLFEKILAVYNDSVLFAEANRHSLIPFSAIIMIRQDKIMDYLG